ncbi:hypothetical protein NC653_007141 [Populus alba x Populus x berolinensis]|uniref:Uncharacterized protein n=1 Tax=Populus alba x Populus x berolinensis TaxID=444605 RepID=A0AAD6RG15_9ROSI|nr:hypothetical protein NC653_007141 [Populus alba x Populus x berolinensis]
MLNHQAVNADCRFSDLGQLQWQSGFCTIRLSLFSLFYAPPPFFPASQLFCNSGAMFIIRCTLMNDEILTSISNPIPADLCAYPLQHIGTIVEFLMGVAIRNHLFTSRYHIKSWKVFKDWLLNKKGLQQGMTGIAFEIHPATLSSTQYNF